MGTTLERWVAHDDPDRPLEYGASFCDCQACLAVLKTTALCQPDLLITIRFGRAPGLVVEAGALLAGSLRDHDLVRRFGFDGDWVRGLSVAKPADR